MFKPLEMMEMIQFDKYLFKGVGSTANKLYTLFFMAEP